MFAWQTEACLSSGLSPLRALNRNLYRMLHNLLAHNSPSGTEPRAARRRSWLWDERRGPALLPLNGFHASCIGMLEHTARGRRHMLFKGYVHQEKKSSHGKVGNRVGVKGAVGLGTWDSALGDVGTSPPFCPPSTWLTLPLPNTTGQLKAESWTPFPPSGKGCSFSCTRL